MRKFMIFSFRMDILKKKLLSPIFSGHQVSHKYIFLVLFIVLLKRVFFKECIHQFVAPLYPTFWTTATSELHFTCYYFCSERQFRCPVPSWAWGVRTYSGNCTAREKNCPFARKREKNCPFARKTVASWSLCSRPGTLWARIYSGSGIAGGLDASRVVPKVSHFQPKYQVQIFNGIKKWG